MSGHLADLPSPGETIAIIGMLGDKDLAGIVTPLADEVDAWIAVSAEGARAVPASELAAGIANLCNTSCLIAVDLSEAMQHAHDRTTGNDRILVTGSFYVVGPALKWLESGA